MYVVDGERICPPGTPGALAFAGAGLASVYLGDEELTRAKFATLAVDGRPVRVYRTGDQGLRDDAGLHHFIGRSDRQIKLRGQRVELDGVEAQTAAIPQVLSRTPPRSLASEGTNGWRCTTPSVRDPCPARSRRPAAGADEPVRRLPPYAVPDLVVVVDRLPRIFNGKVNHARPRACTPSAPWPPCCNC